MDAHALHRVYDKSFSDVRKLSHNSNYKFISNLAKTNN
jgi:hypothetical protein